MRSSPSFYSHFYGFSFPHLSDILGNFTNTVCVTIPYTLPKYSLEAFQYWHLKNKLSRQFQNDSTSPSFNEHTWNGPRLSEGKCSGIPTLHLGPHNFSIFDKSLRITMGSESSSFPASTELIYPIE